MASSQQQIVAWLQSMYDLRTGGRGRVPPFEATAEAFAVLGELFTRVHSRDDEERQLCAVYASETAELHAECARLDRTLASLGWSLQETSSGGLDATARASLVALAQLHAVLGTSTSCARAPADGASGALITSLVALSLERMELERTIDALESASAVATERLRGALAQQAEFSQHVQLFAQRLADARPQMDLYAQKALHVAAKAREYEVEAEALRIELADVLASPDLRHTALQQAASELAALQAELKPRLAKLSAYGDLPPDVSLAALAVEDRRRTLQRLEDDIAQQIHALHPRR